MKYDEKVCRFNMDTGCVELLLRVGHKACRLLAAQVFDFYAHFGERCLIMLTFFFQCKIFFSPAEICGIIWQAGLRVLFKIAVGPILGTMAEIRA